MNSSGFTAETLRTQRPRREQLKPGHYLPKLKVSKRRINLLEYRTVIVSLLQRNPSHRNQLTSARKLFQSLCCLTGLRAVLISAYNLAPRRAVVMKLFLFAIEGKGDALPIVAIETVEI